MKTIFVEDRAYDGYMIWEMLRNEDPAGVDERWKKSGIDRRLLTEILESRTREMLLKYRLEPKSD